MYQYLFLFVFLVLSSDAESMSTEYIWPKSVIKNYKKAGDLSAFLSETPGLKENIFGQFLLKKSKEVKSKPEISQSHNLNQIMFSDNGTLVVVEILGRDQFKVNNQIFNPSFSDSPQNFLQTLNKLIPQKNAGWSPLWERADAFLPVPVGIAIAVGGTILAATAYWRLIQLNKGIKKCRKLTRKVDLLFDRKENVGKISTQSEIDELQTQFDSMKKLTTDAFAKLDISSKKKQADLGSCVRHALRKMEKMGYKRPGKKSGPQTSEK